MSMTLPELLALLPDNTVGDIGADDLRTIITELYNDAMVPPSFQKGVRLGPFAGLPMSAVFAPLPGPSASVPLVLTQPHNVLMVLSAYLDSGVNNNDVVLALDLSGATAIPAGTNPEETLRVGGKQYVESTLSISYVQAFNVGTTTMDVKYTATVAGASISDVAVTMVALS